jgi:integrase
MTSDLEGEDTAEIRQEIDRLDKKLADLGVRRAAQESDWRGCPQAQAAAGRQANRLFRCGHARSRPPGELLRLPQLALDIIAKQPRIAGNPYVFGVGGGKGHFNSHSQRKEELDKKLAEVLLDMTGWVLHDLRRTSRSLLSRAGVRPDISERVLGHAIPGVEGVYDRHSYDQEKADALNRLATLIDTIVHPPEGNGR